MGSAPSRTVQVKPLPKKVDAAAFAMTDDAGRVRDATHEQFEEGYQHTWQKSSSVRVIKANERSTAMKLAVLKREQQEQERLKRIDTALYLSFYNEQSIGLPEEYLDVEKMTALSVMTMKYAFRKWRIRHEIKAVANQRISEARELVCKHSPQAMLFNGFFKWMEFLMILQKASVEGDRRSIEQAIAVAELSFAWETPLADYPQPNSSADCDDCGRKDCFRYYHLDSAADSAPLYDDTGGLDLCESCFVGGEITAAIEPELYEVFELVAPVINAKAAWTDIRDREKTLTQLAFQAKAADLAQKRSETQLAARLFLAAAGDARGNERVLVEARFIEGSQQASVPRGSRAAIIGARNPEQLGKEVLNILSDLRAAPHLATLQLAIKSKLMGPAEIDEYEESANGPVYQMLKSIGVGIAPRRDGSQPRHLLAFPAPPGGGPSSPLRSPVAILPPTTAVLARMSNLSSMTPSELIGSSARQLGASMPVRSMASRTLNMRAAAAPTRSSEGHSSTEFIFLLKQVDATVIQLGVPPEQRKQVQVQFSEGASSMAMSVPYGCRAADLDPGSLGMLLLQATRKAPSLNAAKAALLALLRPMENANAWAATEG